MTVGYSAEEVATEEIKIEEKQRIFGIIPNFYVGTIKMPRPGR